MASDRLSDEKIIRIKNQTMKIQSENDSVAATNDSSTGSKASMASLGYFDDKIIGKFVSKIERRSPLINRYSISAAYFGFLHTGT